MNETELEYYEVIQAFTELCEEQGISKVLNDLPEEVYKGIVYYLTKEGEI